MSIRFFGPYLGLLLLFSLIVNLPVVEKTLIKPWNQVLAIITATLLEPVDGYLRISGNVLSSSRNGFAVAVENDCNGIEVIVLFAAAVIAFPARWRDKAIGLMLGFLVIQTLNVLRIGSLFYLGQWHEGIFHWTHKYLWPVIVLIGTLGAFIAWTRRVTASVSLSAPLTKQP